MFNIFTKFKTTQHFSLKFSMENLVHPFPETENNFSESQFDPKF